MALWMFTYVCLGFGLIDLRPLWIKLQIFFQQNHAVVELRQSAAHLKFLQELLETGVVPSKEEWSRILFAPKPWGKILFESIRELREQGAPVLPSLIRMQKTLHDQAELILEAKLKSAQAFGQAVLGVILVPIFSAILYALMPGVEESGRSFGMLVLFCTLLSSLSFIWIMTMAEQARFGSLASEKRSWVISVNAALERIFALISSGTPADLAWRRAVEELALLDSVLAHAWGAQVWEVELEHPPLIENACERLMVGVGREVRKSIQTSLIEGRPCLDRLESIHRVFLLDLKNKINHELGLLPNRCLKPLFVFILPAVMILMLGGIWFAFEGSAI